MQTIVAFETNPPLSKLLDQIKKGQSIVITEDGCPIAELASIRNSEQIRQAIQAIKAFSQDKTLGGLDWKALRDEGRR